MILIRNPGSDWRCGSRDRSSEFRPSTIPHSSTKRKEMQFGGQVQWLTPIILAILGLGNGEIIRGQPKQKVHKASSQPIKI
jgi:hypothetical protein